MFYKSSLSFDLLPRLMVQDFPVRHFMKLPDIFKKFLFPQYAG